MSELYDECHRLFSYCAETGLLIRKAAILARGGAPHPMPNTKVGDIAGCDNGNGYLKVWVSGKQYRAHRIAWLMQTGEVPKKHIDHVNGIKSDNRWINLREATISENQQNRLKSKNNTSGFKGVYASGRRKNPYFAKIGSDGKKIYLGNFPTPELAHEAYCAKANELHGEFARTS